MAWETEATKSSFDTNSALNTMMEGRQRGDVSGNYSLNTGGYQQGTLREVWLGGQQVTTGYDMIGINGNQVESMRESIRAYVSNIQSVVESTLSTSSSEAYKAFRGEDAITAVNQYIDKVKLYCQNVTSTLLAFSDKLADVGNAWKTAQANIAGTVNSSTAGFSEGTAYQESVTYNR